MNELFVKSAQISQQQNTRGLVRISLYKFYYLFSFLQDCDPKERISRYNQFNQVLSVLTLDCFIKNLFTLNNFIRDCSQIMQSSLSIPIKPGCFLYSFNMFITGYISKLQIFLLGAHYGHHFLFWEVAKYIHISILCIELKIQLLLMFILVKAEGSISHSVLICAKFQYYKFEYVTQNWVINILYIILATFLISTPVYIIIQSDIQIKVMQLSQKPKSLFCYICGREFGTTSLSIHLKSCMKKFQIQQSKKQQKDRIKLPEAPSQLEQILSGNLDPELVQVYNKKASNIHKYEVLPKCRFCSRTFNQQSLKAHQNGCSKKGNQKVQQKFGYNLPDNLKKPRTLTCCVCGRDFGLTSLKIHYPQCLQKFRDDQKKKAKPDRRQPPQFSQQQIDIINNKQDWTLQEIQVFNNKANESYKQKSMVQCPNCGRRFIEESYLKHKKNCVMLNGDKNKSVQARPNPPTPKANLRESFTDFKKPRTLTCCVCGRDFGLTSLKIHYPQCLNKFNSDQMKKPKAQRRVPPQFSQQQLDIINNKQDWTLQEVQEFNNKAAGHYREKAMVQCPNCGRKFLQQSYLKHKKNCALINGTNKNNIPQKNRNASMDVRMRTSTPQLKKPRTLTCCVCGRDFGLTSLKIHYPQCVQKFHNDQKKKPKQQRRVPPQFSQQQLQMINNKQDWTIQEIELFNNKANGSYRDKAMVQCPNCGRKFLQASYLKHKKNCVLINGANQKTDPDQSATQNKKQSNTQLKKPKVLMCHICGRQFGLTSLTIHLPKCRQKFQNLEKKKEKQQQRRPLPIFPQEELKKFDLQKALQWDIQKIQQYNKIANQVYRAQSLCSCPICGRKFFQQSLPKHVKFCQKNKLRQEALDEKARQSSTSKNKSFSRQPGLKKKTSSSVQNNNQKIQQVLQESLNSSPQDVKKVDNDSFLKKSFYLKMQNSSQNKKLEIDISEVDQSLQQTFKGTKKIQKFKIQQNQSLFQESKDQNKMKNQQRQQSIQEKLKSIPIKQSPIRQSRFKENQDRSSKNKESTSLVKELNKKHKQGGNKSQMNKSVALQSSVTRPESRYKDTKAASRPASRKSQNPNKLDDIKVDLPSKNQNNKKQIPRQIISPVVKARQGKGFAAPRKKEQMIQANMKQCKICNRKIDEDRIQKHQKMCQNQQKKSQKNIQNSQVINQSTKLKTSQRPQSAKQLISQRDILSPEEKVRLKKGFAAPRQKQSQIQSLMVQCRGCKRKFTSDRIQKHQSICKLAQENIKQPFVAGTYKKPQQNNKTIQGQKLSIKRVPCPKCNRKFAQQRLQKHVQICKATPTEVKQQKPKLQKKNQNGVQQTKQTAYTIDQAKIQAQKQASQNMNLQMCEKCGRKFLPQRVAKHSQFCKGTLEPNLKDNGLKKQKQLPPAKQYNLQKLQIKEQTQVDNRVQCPRCQRKFLPDRLEKHINACKSVPPLNNLEMKPKVSKKQQINPLKQQKIHMKLSSLQSPKAQQNLIKAIGDDQYVQTQLQQCHKCSRKFVPQRLQKHVQICKGAHKPKTQTQKNNKKAVDSNGKKSNQEQLKKTKNEFFTMVKDLKNKRIKEEEVQKQLDNELHQIQATVRVARKQNINRQNSQKKKPKQSPNRSINLPKI